MNSNELCVKVMQALGLKSVVILGESSTADQTFCTSLNVPTHSEIGLLDNRIQFLRQKNLKSIREIFNEGEKTN